MSAIAARLAAVRERIAQACQEVGRDPGSVTLVGVCKEHSAEAVAAAAAAGLRDFGENRIQDLERKRDSAPGARWHHLGAVQSNKARRIASADLVHGLVPGRGADRLAAAGAERGRAVRALLEVDFTPSGRHGVRPEDVAGSIEALSAMRGIELMGLMCVAPFEARGDRARPYFSRLRELRDRHAPHLPELSMGMSGDFPIAIVEGATMVRVGTAIFGARSTYDEES